MGSNTSKPQHSVKQHEQKEFKHEYEELSEQPQHSVERLEQKEFKHEYEELSEQPQHSVEGHEQKEFKHEYEELSEQPQHSVEGYEQKKYKHKYEEVTVKSQHSVERLEQKEYKHKYEEVAVKSQHSVERLEQKECKHEYEELCEVIEAGQNDMRQSQAPIMTAILKKEFDVSNDFGVRICGMISLDDGRIVMCNSKGKMILVYNSKRECLEVVPVVSYPTNIAISFNQKEGVISFEGENFIQFITLTEELLIPNRKVDLINKCNGGICFKEDTVIVGRKTGFDIYQKDGTCINYVNSSLEQVSFLKHSMGIFAYSDNHTMVIKATNGVQRGSPLTFEGEYATILDAAIHETGTVYCIDCNNNILVKYKDKSQPSVALSSIEGLYRPRALCFSSNYTRLYIANNDGRSIFSISTSFIL